jgi:predicted aspartyl protease
MKFILSLFIVLGISFSAASPFVHTLNPKKEKLEYRELKVEVNSNIYVLTHIRLNNSSRLYRFIIDTGSTGSSISKKVADALGLEMTGTDQVTDGYSYENLSTSQLDMDIEGIIFKGLEVDVMTSDMSGRGQVCAIDGILGSNVLKKHVWSFRKGQVGVQSQVDKKQLSDFSKYKMKLQFGGVPTLVAGFKGTRSTSLIDLGFNGNITTPISNVEYLWGKQERTGKGQLIHTAFNNPAPTKTRILKVPEFDFGSPKEHKKYGTAMSIQEVIVDVEEEEHYPIQAIGAGLLNSFEMVIDFPKERLYIKKINDSKAHSILNTFGFVVNPNTRSVEFIWDDSPAAKLGLQLGDEIQKLNHLNLMTAEFKALADCERQSKISEILRNTQKVNLLAIRKDGIQLKGQLSKVALFTD